MQSSRKPTEPADFGVTLNPKVPASIPGGALRKACSRAFRCSRALRLERTCPGYVARSRRDDVVEGPASFRPGLPGRPQARPGVVRQVPAAGRPAGPEAHRVGVDAVRPAG